MKIEIELQTRRPGEELQSETHHLSIWSKDNFVDQLGELLKDELPEKLGRVKMLAIYPS